MKRFITCLPHLTISMLLVLTALVILDSFNPAMGFLNSNSVKVFLIMLCLVGIVNAVYQVWQNSKNTNQK